MAIALAEHLKKVDARPERDLLLVHFALPYGTVARRAARSVGIPYTIYFRGDDVWIDPHRDGAKRMTGFVESVSDADLVLAVSQSLIDEAARLTGKPFGRAAVVHNGIDLERFQPAVSYDERQRLRNALMISPDEVAVLCVGDALNRKGWIEILDALGSMRNPSIVLVAVDGGGKEEVDICAEAARRAPSVRLRYFRNLDAEHLADIYRATDIFCLLSHWEGLSNAVLEAMASGLAVVTTAVAGHPEIISDGIEGFLVPPRSAEAAKYAIVRLVDAPSLRERVGAAARRRAELIGDARKNGERLAGLLGGLLRDGEDSHARRNM
jgi:glycosyltransferase involved in cell wall biosynthesis